MAQIPNTDKKDSLLCTLGIKIKTLCRLLSLLQTKLPASLAPHQQSSWFYRPLSCCPNLS